MFITIKWGVTYMKQTHQNVKGLHRGIERCRKLPKLRKNELLPCNKHKFWLLLLAKPKR